MARPNKPGLNYFPLDCVQSNDLRFIRAKFGLEGYGIVLNLWQTIYGEEGYYMRWDQRSQYLFAMECNLPIERVQEVIDCCMHPLTSIFDKGLYETHGILTSKDIQERWLKVIKECKRKGIFIKEEYNLLEEEGTEEAGEAVFEAEERRQPLKEEAGKSPANNTALSGKFRVLPEVFPKIPEETTQRKEKEIKENKIKEEERGSSVNLLTEEEMPSPKPTAGASPQAFAHGAAAPVAQAPAPAEAGSPKKSLEERRNLFRKKMEEVAAGRSAEGMPLLNAPTYSQVMQQKFFTYWTECNTNGRKMRFEMEKVFEMARRLATWKAKEEEFSRQRTFNRSASTFNTNSLKPLGYEPKKRPGGYGTL